MSDVIRMQQLLQGGTLSDAEVASLRQCAEAISRTARQSARRIGRTFALLCETFATVEPEQLPPELRAEIEAIALGRDLPEPDTSGPVTPMDLLQIATRLAEMGERADAARLRRLADDLVAKRNEVHVTALPVGWSIKRKSARKITIKAPDGSGTSIDDRDDSIAGVVLWELAKAMLSIECGDA